MTVRVKICGLTTASTVEAAAFADWIGFNFIPASPRVVTPVHAAALSAGGAPGPGRVGLFADPSDDEIAAVLAEMNLAAIQLYASAARAEDIRGRFAIPVWRAVGVSSVHDLPHAPSDAYVLDAAPPPCSATQGGNAITFDWSVLQGWSAPAPWLLAGGLTPDNVAAAIAISGACAVDVSSGVETRRGVKDPALIAAFLDAAHAV